MSRARRTHTPAHRAGFTLIEMLVVIAIIVVLVALLASGIFYWIGTQQSRNTASTIRDVTKALNGQWAWVIDQAKKEPASPAVRAMAGSDPTGARAKVLWIKVRLMEAFPINYSEVNGSGDPKNPDPIYTFLYTTQIPAGSGQLVIPPGQQKYLRTYQRALGNGTLYQDLTGTSATESSACLLMALAVARGGVALSPDSLGRFVTDTDGDGINEIIDNYSKSQPLSFYRFGWGTSPLAFSDNTNLPYGIQSLNPAPGDLSKAPATWSKGFRLGDPVDPDGMLVSWASPWAGVYSKLFHPITPPSNGSVATYVIPVVVSNGVDGKLGLPSPRTLNAMGGFIQGAAVAPSPYSDARDNVYSFKLKGN